MANKTLCFLLLPQLGLPPQRPHQARQCPQEDRGTPESPLPGPPLDRRRGRDLGETAGRVLRGEAWRGTVFYSGAVFEPFGGWGGCGGEVG